jgi:hypothetical protein
MSTVREQAIEAGARAWASVRPVAFGTPYAFERARVAAVVDAVEPIIRADERDKRELLDWTYASVEAGVRERLRAQVEALPIYSTRIGYEWLSPGGWQPSDRVISTIQRVDVLALLDGESNG